MYKLRFLPIADEDLRGAVQHILDAYENASAAMDLADEILRQIEILTEFPYAHPLYHARMRLPGEIRFFPVRNYNVFYQVLEPEHVVEIRRILYSRMEPGKQGIFS